MTEDFIWQHPNYLSVQKVARPAVSDDLKKRVSKIIWEEVKHMWSAYNDWGHVLARLQDANGKYSHYSLTNNGWLFDGEKFDDMFEFMGGKTVVKKEQEYYILYISGHEEVITRQEIKRFLHWEH